MSVSAKPTDPATEGMGPHQKLALFAFQHRLRRCSDIRYSSLPGVEAVDGRARWLDDYADHLLLALRESDQSAPLSVEAATHLLSDPSSELSGGPDAATRGGWESRYTHDCPLCGLPARHYRGFPESVCAECSGVIAAADGTPLTVSVEGVAGGEVTVAEFADEPGSPVTRSDVRARGGAWVRGVEVDLWAHGDVLVVHLHLDAIRFRSAVS